MDHPTRTASHNLSPPRRFQLSAFQNFFFVHRSFFPPATPCMRASLHVQEPHVLLSLPWSVVYGALEPFPIKNVQIYVYTGFSVGFQAIHR